MLGQVAIGFAMSPLQVIIHESGHAIAACILHKNANPKIELRNYGYIGGGLRYDGNSLSKVGEWLGISNATAVICAAGPVVDMVTALALLRFFPGNGYSFVGLQKTFYYVISALSEKGFYTNKKEDDNGHDFVGVKINKGGLAASALIISCVAAQIFATYSTIEQCKKLAYIV